MQFTVLKHENVFDQIKSGWFLWYLLLILVPHFQEDLEFNRLCVKIKIN